MKEFHPDGGIAYCKICQFGAGQTCACPSDSQSQITGCGRDEGNDIARSLEPPPSPMFRRGCYGNRSSALLVHSSFGSSEAALSASLSRNGSHERITACRSRCPRKWVTPAGDCRFPVSLPALFG